MTPSKVKRTLRKTIFAALILILLAAQVMAAQAATSQGGNPEAPSTGSGPAGPRSRTLYMPSVQNNYTPPQPPVLLGVYPLGWQGLQSTMDNELDQLSAWSGVKITFSATFIGLSESANNIYKQLSVPWENGYTPFVNMMTTSTARSIAAGRSDGDIRTWAANVRDYADGGRRIVYIAPLPEMNGEWTSYGLDADGFKSAFRHIQDIFAQEGVPDESVRWVFSPNGWSESEHDFEYYYPGDAWVDAVGFSAYNYGHCPYPGQKSKWVNVDEIALPYIKRMRAMAPSKPIFLTQFATSARTESGRNDEAKNEWFRTNYAILANTEGVRAILYFNHDDSICDLAFFTPDRQYTGYRDVVNSSNYEYLKPAELVAAGK